MKHFVDLLQYTISGFPKPWKFAPLEQNKITFLSSSLFYTPLNI